MYIFLSYNHKDKEVVETVALKLEGLFGRDSIFFDAWSIQPGEGIIDKMNEGLGNMDYFFFFVSRNSLESNMVKLEWQNAIFKASNGKCRFVPVKIDDCVMPPILLQNLYIDFYNNGLETGFIQMVDVINGVNTFKRSNAEFQNTVCYLKKLSDSQYELEFAATRFVEPISQNIVLFKEKCADIKFELLTDRMYVGGKQEGIKLSNGDIWNGYSFDVRRATTPSFPVRIRITKKDGNPFGPILASHSDSENRFQIIKLIQRI